MLKTPVKLAVNAILSWDTSAMMEEVSTAKCSTTTLIATTKRTKPYTVASILSWSVVLTLACFKHRNQYLTMWRKDTNFHHWNGSSVTCHVWQYASVKMIQDLLVIILTNQKFHHFMTLQEAFANALKTRKGSQRKREQSYQTFWIWKKILSVRQQDKLKRVRTSSQHLAISNRWLWPGLQENWMPINRKKRKHRNKLLKLHAVFHQEREQPWVVISKETIKKVSRSPSRTESLKFWKQSWFLKKIHISQWWENVSCLCRTKKYMKSCITERIDLTGKRHMSAHQYLKCWKYTRRCRKTNLWKISSCWITQSRASFGSGHVVTALHTTN